MVGLVSNYHPVVIIIYKQYVHTQTTKLFSTQSPDKSGYEVWHYKGSGKTCVCVCLCVHLGNIRLWQIGGRETQKKNEAMVWWEKANVNMHKCSELGLFPKCLKRVRRFSQLWVFFPDLEAVFEFDMFEVYMLFSSPGAVQRTDPQSSCKQWT